MQNEVAMTPHLARNRSNRGAVGEARTVAVGDRNRISDARMSGTAYGSNVLHVAPDAASGGPLAKVHNGDRIRLSVKERRINLLVPPDESARRRATPPPMPECGCARLYRNEILQADRGSDFNFLRKYPLEEEVGLA